MKSISFTLLLSLCIVSSMSYANDGLIIKSSAYSVAETLDRFEQIVTKKGIHVFARINHAQGAKKAGLSLLPSEVIIFGKPQLGTPLMQSSASVAIDLPLKATAWQDKDAKVWLAYNAPDYIAKRHGITDQNTVIKKMTGALNKFSDFATQAKK